MSRKENMNNNTQKSLKSYINSQKDYIDYDNLYITDRAGFMANNTYTHNNKCYMSIGDILSLQNYGYIIEYQGKRIGDKELVKVIKK